MNYLHRPHNDKNVYDRKNIAGYYWNNEKQQPEVMYQWRLLPVIGIQYAF